MAEIISNRVPIDSDKRRAVGFKLPMDGSAVFIPTYTTRDQIKSNLINYMLTNKGERYMNPEFGSNLRALLFQQIDDGDLDDLITEIQLNVNTQFPTIEVKELFFNKTDESKDRNEISFTMTYQVQILGIEDELLILLQ